MSSLSRQTDDHVPNHEPRAEAPFDTFARDRLPASHHWPDLLFEIPRYFFQGQLNVAVELVDRHLAQGRGEHPCLIDAGTGEGTTYRQLFERINRIARVLTEDMDLRTGNRVLLRSPNTPMLVACWLAVVKAGGIVVLTMPLLRARELGPICDRLRIGLALCDDRLVAELEAAYLGEGSSRRILTFSEIAERMRGKPADFTPARTDAADICLIAFTSGTTGIPKAAAHFHRDLMAATEGLPRLVLDAQLSDVFCAGSSLAFTYGLGGAMLFPLRLGATSVLVETPTPKALLDALSDHSATICLSIPTAYRSMTELVATREMPKLRACTSAAETLPSRIIDDWRAMTGLPIIDTIGSTEMLHTFIANPPDALRPGATGKPLPGYQAIVVDEEFRQVPAGEVGRLAVRGPIGCRYLDDPRQAQYVQHGWNVTGDAYLVDEDGYFWYQGRTDDMIVSAGYNISGIEVEAVLLEHAAVRECAVVASPDDRRGTIPKAFVVPREPVRPGSGLIGELQEFVKKQIAPYKYPRRVEFLDALPRTETGKIQRFKLRELEIMRVETEKIER
jgi:2-aminobenzoate-CoA ligase